MLELLSPINQVIVSQNKNQIVFHGVRNLITLVEEKIEKWALVYGWEIPNTFNLNSLHDCIQYVDKLSPNESEGLVICDENFKRYKIKGKLYVTLAYSNSSGKINLVALVKVIQANEGEEFISNIPQWKSNYDTLKFAYDTLAENIDSYFLEIPAIYTIQEFSKSIRNQQDLWYSDCLFQLKKEYISSSIEWLSKYNPKHLHNYLINYS